MKVTFIYAHEEGEQWSTPMALIKEFQLRGWKTEIVSIGSNRTGQYHDMKLQRWVELKPDSDVVIFMDWGRFDSPYLNKQLVPNAFWIQESGDDPQNWERNSPKANRFHYTITPDYDSYFKYKQMGINVEWITHFADTEIQYPMNLEPEYVAVTTRGFGNSQFLDYLTNWAQGAIGNKNGMEGIEHTKFLNKGLMIIQNSRWGEITRRIFEGMACGKMILTDRLNDNKKLHELFKENEEIVFYDNMADCIEKMNYYNDNEEEREKIAYNGYQKVINNFTQKQVVDKLISKHKEYIMYKN
jgi:glycosyltransferase involved in cell wall biosynthesis